jgi:hypothetical protein
VATQHNSSTANTAKAKRCPACGGLNSPTAQWCGQCLSPFAAPPPPPPQSAPETEAEEFDPLAPWQEFTREQEPRKTGIAGTEEFDPLTAPALGSMAPSAIADPPPPPAATVRRGAWQVEGDVIMWTCSICEHHNPLEARSCEVCGATFAIEMTTKDSSRPARDPNAAALYSLFFPGAGHAYLGLVGQAVARGVMSVWVVGVALLSMLSGGGSASLLLSLSYGLAAVGLWLAAAHDAYREAKDQPGLVVLSGRRFLYVTIALISVLFMVMIFGALGARG